MVVFLYNYVYNRKLHNHDLLLESLHLIGRFLYDKKKWNNMPDNTHRIVWGCRAVIPQAFIILWRMSTEIALHIIIVNLHKQGHTTFLKDNA